jgi:hypothetical protein
MKLSLIPAAMVLALGGVAQAGDVFISKDAQGRPIYTDRPDTLPAQRLDVKSSSTDVVAVKARAAEQQAQYAAASKASAEADQKAKEAKQAADLTQADRAKKCVELRDYYLQLMNARGLYEKGENEGERRYLSAEEIDTARENAKRSMDEFCSEQ